MAGPGGEGRRRRSCGGGRSPARGRKCHGSTRARSQRDGRSGRRTGRAASGSRRLLLLKGRLLGRGLAGSSLPLPRRRRRLLPSRSLPRLGYKVSLAGPCSSGGGARAGPSGRRGRAGPGPRRGEHVSLAAPPRRRCRPPSPRSRTWARGGPGEPRGGGVACAGPEPHAGGRRPKLWPGHVLAVGGTSPRPRGAVTAAPSFPSSLPGRRAGPRAPKLGEESWRRGGAARNWRRRGLSWEAAG